VRLSYNPRINGKITKMTSLRKINGDISKFTGTSICIEVFVASLYLFGRK